MSFINDIKSRWSALRPDLRKHIIAGIAIGFVGALIVLIVALF